MNPYQTPLRDIEFALFDVLQYSHHCQDLGATQLDAGLATAFLQEAGRFADEQLAPLNSIGDRQGCKLDAGQVKTPQGFREAYQQYCAMGWPSLCRNQDYGGQGMPQSLGIVLSEIIGTPCWSWSMYVGLSQGAMHTLETHGTDEQKQTYLPHLISGRWTGTMCLTESQAGSDLGLLRTRAEPDGQGGYRITGTKIFISSGDHDLAENIVHIVLARLPDAPPGTRGISLFVVPKFLPAGAGLGARNNIVCSRLEEKMGIHGNATCELVFDGAQAWLLGDINKGLNLMFTFMNLARIGSGIQGVAHAEFGYQLARSYARERLQMRALSGAKSPDAPADPIIVHPDVRRMLLTQKAITEGLRMLAYDAALKIDQVQSLAESAERQKANELLSLLTPIVKAFSTELGFESANLALQCFGGHGYIREWGVEQNLRDCRIASLYEGTTGIQALDLLARKVLANSGQTLELLLAELRDFCADNQAVTELQRYLQPLQALLPEWADLTRALAQKAASNADEIGAAAVDYLMYSGYLLLAYYWARAARQAEFRLQAADPQADFYRAKLATADFYFARLLPRTSTHAALIRAGADSLMGLAAGDF